MTKWASIAETPEGANWFYFRFYFATLTHTTLERKPTMSNLTLNRHPQMAPRFGAPTSNPMNRAAAPQPLRFGSNDSLEMTSSNDATESSNSSQPAKKVPLLRQKRVAIGIGSGISVAGLLGGLAALLYGVLDRCTPNNALVGAGGGIMATSLIAGPLAFFGLKHFNNRKAAQEANATTA